MLDGSALHDALGAAPTAQLAQGKARFSLPGRSAGVYRAGCPALSVGSDAIAGVRPISRATTGLNVRHPCRRSYEPMQSRNQRQIQSVSLVESRCWAALRSRQRFRNGSRAARLSHASTPRLHRCPVDNGPACREEKLHQKGGPAAIRFGARNFGTLVSAWILVLECSGHQCRNHCFRNWRIRSACAVCTPSSSRQKSCNSGRDALTPMQAAMTCASTRWCMSSTSRTRIR